MKAKLNPKTNCIALVALGRNYNTSEGDIFGASVKDASVYISKGHAKLLEELPEGSDDWPEFDLEDSPKSATAVSSKKSEEKDEDVEVQEAVTLPNEDEALKAVLKDDWEKQPAEDVRSWATVLCPEGSPYNNKNMAVVAIEKYLAQPAPPAE